PAEDGGPRPACAAQRDRPRDQPARARGRRPACGNHLRREHLQHPGLREPALRLGAEPGLSAPRRVDDGRDRVHVVRLPAHRLRPGAVRPEDHVALTPATNADVAALPPVSYARGGLLRDGWRRLRRDKMGMLGLTVTALFVLVAIFGPFFAP